MKTNGLSKESSGLADLEELIPLRKGGLLIGVPYETMRRYVKERRIPYYKVFGRIKVSKQELRALCSQWRIAPLQENSQGVPYAIGSEAQTTQRQPA